MSSLILGFRWDSFVVLVLAVAYFIGLLVYYVVIEPRHKKGKENTWLRTKNHP
jgi:peptidoglycan/LPS O-acetylase OafA/YrhL